MTWNFGLQDLIDHSSKVYGRRNRIYAASPIDRINCLNLAIGDLQDGLRKGGSKERLAIALARIVSRIFCFAEAFVKLPLVPMMVRKYPASGCSYCHQFPCGCGENRANSRPVQEVEEAQLFWRLSDWQKGLGALYGENNRRKGMDYVLLRLFKEVSELLSFEMQIPETQLSVKEIEEELALELADTLAWTIAMANMLEIDIQASFVERYGNGCGKCNVTPCGCGRFSKRQMSW